MAPSIIFNLSWEIPRIVHTAGISLQKGNSGVRPCLNLADNISSPTWLLNKSQGKELSFRLPLASLLLPLEIPLEAASSLSLRVQVGLIPSSQSVGVSPTDLTPQA